MAVLVCRGAGFVLVNWSLSLPRGVSMENERLAWVSCGMSFIVGLPNRVSITPCNSPFTVTLNQKEEQAMTTNLWYLRALPRCARGSRTTTMSAGFKVKMCCGRTPMAIFEDSKRVSRGKAIS